MDLWSLAREYETTRVWVLPSETFTQCIIEAARFYSAYGEISSLKPAVPAVDVTASKPNGVVLVTQNFGSWWITPPTLATVPLPDQPATAAPAPAPSSSAIPSGFAGQDLGGITEATVLTPGEWAIIKPLFTLYVERESAMHLEASRGLGVDVYGRSVAEVQGDITLMETETLPAKSFCHDMIEV
jgi:hypothetical protein